MPCINVHPTIASVVYKNGDRKASYAMKKFGIEYQEFLLRKYAIRSLIWGYVTK